MNQKPVALLIEVVDGGNETGFEVFGEEAGVEDQVLVCLEEFDAQTGGNIILGFTGGGG